MVSICQRSGSAASHHALELGELLAGGDGRPLSTPQARLWRFEIDRPALVIGSRARRLQSQIDYEACSRRGVEVVERRSGGGVVLLIPGSSVWIDLVVPAGQVGLPDDVVSSMEWFGECWQKALSAQVPELGTLEMHRGSELPTSWSSLICFAGRGPGEVFVDGGKLVGISQRRTRHGIRFQSVAYLRYDERELLELLSTEIEPGELPDVCELGDAVEVEALASALQAACCSALDQTRSKTSSTPVVPSSS